MKKRYVLFWIKSARGTDGKAVFEISKSKLKDKEFIKRRLELWCSGWGAWSASENVVTYGYKPITIPPRKELLKAWDKLCDRKHKIDDKYKTMQVMFNPHKL